MAIHVGGYTTPFRVPRGGELAVASQPAPGDTGAAIPMLSVPPLVGMTVAAGAVTATEDASWIWTGGIIFSSTYETEYTIDLELWLQWVLPFNGETVTSDLIAVSGLLGGPGTTLFAVPTDFEISMSGGAPVTLYCRTFGRDLDTSVTMAGGFLVHYLQDRNSSDPVLLALLARAPSLALAGPEAPWSGTDRYMIYAGDWIPTDTYKRGIVVNVQSGRYVANKDNPAGTPGSSDDWKLIGRGQVGDPP